MVAARWLRNCTRSCRHSRRGPRGKPRVSASDGCSAIGSPNSVSRLRPLISSDSALRNRPPRSQPSATIRRSQERSRPGARSPEQAHRHEVGIEGDVGGGDAGQRRNPSGMRRSMRWPKRPRRRSRKSTDAGSSAPEPNGASGGGSPRSRHTVLEHGGVDHAALLEHVDHRPARREPLAHVVREHGRPDPERDEATDERQQQPLDGRELAHAADVLRLFVRRRLRRDRSPCRGPACCPSARPPRRVRDPASGSCRRTRFLRLPGSPAPARPPPALVGRRCAAAGKRRPAADRSAIIWRCRS